MSDYLSFTFKRGIDIWWFLLILQFSFVHLLLSHLIGKTYIEEKEVCLLPTPLENEHDIMYGLGLIPPTPTTTTVTLVH